MTRGTREQLLTHMAQAQNDIKRAQENLLFLAETYRPVHPELGDIVDMFILALEQVSQALSEFERERM